MSENYSPEQQAILIDMLSIIENAKGLFSMQHIIKLELSKFVADFKAISEAEPSVKLPAKQIGGELWEGFSTRWVPTPTGDHTSLEVYKLGDQEQYFVTHRIFEIIGTNDMSIGTETSCQSYLVNFQEDLFEPYIIKYGTNPEENIELLWNEMSNILLREG